MTEHTPDEFGLEVRDATGAVCVPRVTRVFDAGWGPRPKRTQLVFIGKNLDQSRMRQDFEICLA